MTVLALLGAKALYLLWIWMASGIVASYLSRRKGYGERVGLATGTVALAERCDALRENEEVRRAYLGA